MARSLSNSIMTQPRTQPLKSRHTVTESCRCRNHCWDHSCISLSTSQVRKSRGNRSWGRRSARMDSEGKGEDGDGGGNGLQEEPYWFDVGGGKISVL
ncbi:unnamed protein product [Linum trigynum]|uniref:Uncharacterized protein n=1 Tax=Linum trigynum TaxID=586398 RepID=A0AAV2ESJ9_9ROSI